MNLIFFSSTTSYRIVKDCKYALLVATARPSRQLHDHDDKHLSAADRKDKEKEKEKEKKDRQKEDLVQAAVDGTLNVLRAIAETNPEISRVVLTSSLSAVAGKCRKNKGQRLKDKK